MLNIYWVRKWYDWEFRLPVLALNQTQRKSFMPVTLDFQHAMVRRSNMTSHDVKIYLLFLYTMSTQSRQILCWCGFSILLKFWCLKRDGDGRRYNRRFLKLGFSDVTCRASVGLHFIWIHRSEFTGLRNAVKLLCVKLAFPVSGVCVRMEVDGNFSCWKSHVTGPFSRFCQCCTVPYSHAQVRGHITLDSYKLFMLFSIEPKKFLIKAVLDKWLILKLARWASKCSSVPPSPNHT